MTVSHLRAASASGRVPSLVTNGGTRRFADAQTFVERWTGAPGGYRIPALVRELLTARLAYDAPEEFAALRRLCAEWATAAAPPAQASFFAGRPRPTGAGGAGARYRPGRRG